MNNSGKISLMVMVNFHAVKVTETAPKNYYSKQYTSDLSVLCASANINDNLKKPKSEFNYIQSKMESQ